MKRCAWAEKSEFSRSYHDFEWGRAVKDDKKFFEMLILEGFQAGLSWDYVLRKRAGLAQILDGFDAKKIALYDEKKLQSLLSDDRAIKNRLKIYSLPKNAKAFLELCAEFGSFYNYIYKFTNGKRVINDIKCAKDMPASSELSKRISKDMKKLGFKFVGAVIIYSFLQGVGVIDDHENECFCKGKI